MKLQIAGLLFTIVVSQLIVPFTRAQNVFPFSDWDLFSYIAQRGVYYDLRLVFSDGTSLLLSDGVGPDLIPGNKVYELWLAIQEAGEYRRVNPGTSQPLSKLQLCLENLDLRKGEVRLLRIKGFLSDYVMGDKNDEELEDLGSVWPP